MSVRHERLIIIGSGPAGYTAAIYAARAMLKPMLIEGLQPGGQLTITTDVENYPGFADVIQGPWLMEQMRAQAKHVGTEIVDDIIVKVGARSRRPFRLMAIAAEVYLADAVDHRHRRAGALAGSCRASSKFQGFGVSACATCDGFFYRGKEVLVIGGGNTAVEEALYLANLASKVTLIHRRDELRAEKILQERLFESPEDRSGVGHRARRDRRHGRAARRHRHRHPERRRPAQRENANSTASSSPSATRRRRRFSRARSR